MSSEVTFTPVGTQIDVIKSVATVTVVLGGAGTGKTTTAAAAAADFIRSNDASHDAQRHRMLTEKVATPLPSRARVLLISFSRTAVAQVVERAGLVVGPLLNRMDMVTFHGFAWRIVNDWGPAYGHPPPIRIQSEAEHRVQGSVPDSLRYAELIPMALDILNNDAVSDYYRRRYALVICDEFQDTSNEEWQFMQAIAPTSRRILLGDVNQCIYAKMKRIDPDLRVADALRLPGSVPIYLPVTSHRDTTGVLPAAADAARERRFNDAAFVSAVKGRRLVVTRIGGRAPYETPIKIIAAERAEQHTVSVFTHTNAATTELSDVLTESGVRHEQVGLSEAYAEALNAQAAMLRYALHGVPGRSAFAVYVAANYRAHTPLVQDIVQKTNPVFERALSYVANDLLAASNPLDVDRLADVVSGAYSRLGTRRGQETWTLAARRTRAALRHLRDGGPFSVVEAELERYRHSTLVGNGGLRPHPVQVMNLHQTKGREADVTILLLQDDEYHGNEGHPYPTLSRLLYVVLTRARRRAHIVVPDRVHPLWSPIVDTYDRLIEETTLGS
ncbi:MULTISPECIES: UvrD-helicase domain-containing protein [unclassified Rhodococcus (in: high G+C Gram-positive bacteria)]|uniref:UvrD-helicase domain-containing protein n=1 Tax=unclassified Rhodococcus (in: high G+C Gram-positive bacteria) TaxID=192944 RepID=UPI001C3E383A|nr:MULTISPECIES: UvrD-helicase domain-containing protein [unclassified Rhodococcus (in: high G+C Gram-positive bacteria)]